MARRRTTEEAFSLFSFQDIITSVTGVIILVTLMLAVELSKRKPTPAPNDQSAAEQIQSKLEAAGNEIAAWREVVDSDQSFIDEVASLPASEVARAEQTLTRRVVEMEAVISELRRAESSSQARLKEFESESRKAAGTTLAQLRARTEALRDELELITASNRVVYNPSPHSQKAAWLVDLQADRIHVSKPGASSDTRVFTASSEVRRIAEFLGWAQARDGQSEYFVLLVRPESITFHDAVYEDLRDRQFELGFDLLASDVEVVVAFENSGSKP